MLGLRDCVQISGMSALGHKWDKPLQAESVFVRYYPKADKRQCG
jgi:hypothetical protein